MGSIWIVVEHHPFIFFCLWFINGFSFKLLFLILSWLENVSSWWSGSCSAGAINSTTGSSSSIFTTTAGDIVHFPSRIESINSRIWSRWLRFSFVLQLLWRNSLFTSIFVQKWILINTSWSFYDFIKARFNQFTGRSWSTIGQRRIRWKFLFFWELSIFVRNVHKSWHSTSVKVVMRIVGILISHQLMKLIIKS